MRTVVHGLHINDPDIFTIMDRIARAERAAEQRALEGAADGDGESDGELDGEPTGEPDDLGDDMPHHDDDGQPEGIDGEPDEPGSIDGPEFEPDLDVAIVG